MKLRCKEATCHLLIPGSYWDSKADSADVIPDPEETSYPTGGEGEVSALATFPLQESF